ncbi:MAG TPA: sulfatase-like hydrolase/transferase, partial [Candidatus Hydrogenedentes bacterium]|nr:sulfatase-like hydrolase/transferase [Candidatus Hydrogenedentota bacterium]
LLAVIMAILLCGVIVCLLLLLQPRAIQILVSVLPLPTRARRLVNRFGSAATAYAHRRTTLLLALLFGFGVHLGTCATFQCTFMAIRARDASVADILFVSPLMIAASVLALTISGMGVREAAFGLVLGPKAGHASAILGGHLELWAGEIIPFALSVPLLLWGGLSREAARRLRQELASLRSSGALSAELPELDPVSTRIWRRAMAGILTAGFLGGGMAGTLVALLEAAWITRSLPWAEDAGLFWWGGVAYGLLFAGAGMGAAAGWLFIAMLRGRPPRWSTGIALGWAAAFFSGALVIGLFRIQRDILGGHALTLQWYAAWILLCGGVGSIGFGIAMIKGNWLAAKAGGHALRLNLLAAAGWVMLLLVCLGAGKAALAVFPKPPSASARSRTVPPAGAPNVILCAIDALRADVLKAWNPAASTDTPALDALTRDAVVYRQAFAGSTWTKPSFATMFTGRHPHDHGAVSKTSAIRPGLKTLAGCLQEAGWHTAGFSNNPNTLALFGFNAGFDTYTDLKPNPLPGATPGATRLSLYQLIRKVFLTIEGKLRGGRIRITDFYQPAENITNIALRWCDTERPADRPFYLYLHYMDTH